MASNNYALIIYLLGHHDQAQKSCERQIRFSEKYLPRATLQSLQPHINIIRLNRGIGNYEIARQLIEKFKIKVTQNSDNCKDKESEETAFLARIFLQEKFLLALKADGPSALPVLLSEVENFFPALKETASYAERTIIAGILCNNESLLRQGFSNPCWKMSSHASLIRTLYMSYWLAHLGDNRQASQLVKRMAGLGREAYRWKDHAVLRLLERLASLATMVGENQTAAELNLIRIQVAKELGDVSALISSIYELRTLHDDYLRLWRRLAERSGYTSFPGIPRFSARSKTFENGHLLLQAADQKIIESYAAYADANGR